MDPFDLMDSFEAYLVATFVVTLLLRMRNQARNVRFLLSFPRRWPRLYEIVLARRTMLFRLPTLLAAVAALALVAAHSAAIRTAWPQASVTAAGLRGHFWLTASLLVAGTAMVSFDLRSIWVAARRTPARSVGWYEVAEVLLAAGLAPLIRWRVGQTLLHASLLLNRWIWRWTAQLVLRLQFGLLLWLAWVRTR